MGGEEEKGERDLKTRPTLTENGKEKSKVRPQKRGNRKNQSTPRGCQGRLIDYIITRREFGLSEDQGVKIQSCKAIKRKDWHG